MAVQRELFVIMPFTEPWSDGVHSFIRRVAALLGASHGQLYLYRADEIAVPGRITDQIREALASADVVIADITGLNPNVMWELGCADGLGKTSVILNQNPGSSPFDLGNRRQVAYHMPPTEDDEKRMLRHLVAALRASDSRDKAS